MRKANRWLAVLRVRQEEVVSRNDSNQGLYQKEQSGCR